jgi:hypothetical protein
MKVDIFCLCDFAQSASEGKMTIVGIFDSLFSENLPAIHGLFAVAIKLKIDPSEIGPKKIKLMFLGPDQTTIGQDVESTIVIPPTHGSIPMNVQLVTLVPFLRLPQFGEYSVVLQIDEQQVASTPLYLRQAPLIPPHLQTPPLGA